MKKIFILAMTLLFLLPSTVLAGKPLPGPLDLTQASGGGQSNRIIEKQTWWINGTTPDPNHTVINPGGYGTWDINEHNGLVAGGYMLPGATTTGTYRHIWDWNPIYNCYSGYCAYWSGRSNWWGANVDSVSDQLDVSVCFQTQGKCFDLLPKWNPTIKMWRYKFCGQALYRLDDPAIIPIPGSNGGSGVPSVMTLTVTNPTTTKIKTIYGDFGISSDGIFTSGCSVSDPNDAPQNADYPLFWVQF